MCVEPCKAQTWALIVVGGFCGQWAAPHWAAVGSRHPPASLTLSDKGDTSKVQEVESSETCILVSPNL